MSRTARAALVLAALTVACAGGAPSDEGVAAYRDKDYARAWAALEPLAKKGHYRAQRYLAFMLLQGNAPVDCGNQCADQAVALLLDAATRGDNNAVIVLEGMIASGQSYAPGEADMLAMETKRAKAGDPVMAWRLAERYRNGEGVAPSPEKAVRWLRVAAKGDASTYPKAADAAFRLCEAYARGEGVAPDAGEALNWCKRAAKAGHKGAAIMIARLDADE